MNFGGAVGISVFLTFIVSIILGLVVGAMIAYCVVRRQIHRRNKEQTPPLQLQKTPPAGPVYEEVSQPKEEIDLKLEQTRLMDQLDTDYCYITLLIFGTLQEQEHA